VETLTKLVPRNGKFWSICFVLWFGLLTYFSSQPPSEEQPGLFDIPHGDKIAHFGFFFGGAGLLAAALFYGKSLSRKSLLVVVTISLSLVGVYDEIHQTFTPGRTGADLADWLADTGGAFIGACVFRWVQRKFLN